MKQHYPTGKEVADEFMRELKGGRFTMSREPPSSGSPYSPKIAARDSKAVEEFTKTDLFQDIMNFR